MYQSILLLSAGYALAAPLDCRWGPGGPQDSQKVDFGNHTYACRDPVRWPNGLISLVGPDIDGNSGNATANFTSMCNPEGKKDNFTVFQYTDGQRTVLNVTVATAPVDEKNTTCAQIVDNEIIAQLFEAKDGPCDHLRSELKNLKPGKDDQKIKAAKQPYSDILDILRKNQTNFVFTDKTLSDLKFDVVNKSREEPAYVYKTNASDPNLFPRIDAVYDFMNQTQNVSLALALQVDTALNKTFPDIKTNLTSVFLQALYFAGNATKQAAGGSGGVSAPPNTQSTTSGGSQSSSTVPGASSSEAASSSSASVPVQTASSSAHTSAKSEPSDTGDEKPTSVTPSTVLSSSTHAPSSSAQSGSEGDEQPTLSTSTARTPSSSAQTSHSQPSDTEGDEQTTSTAHAPSSSAQASHTEGDQQSTPPASSAASSHSKPSDTEGNDQPTSSLPLPSSVPPTGQPSSSPPKSESSDRHHSSAVSASSAPSAPPKSEASTAEGSPTSSVVPPKSEGSTTAIMITSKAEATATLLASDPPKSVTSTGGSSHPVSEVQSSSRGSPSASVSSE